MTFRLRDVALGLVLYLAARFRWRFLRADSPVFTLADEIDFARFSASIGKVPEDPVHARLIEGGEIDEWWDVDLPRA